MPGRTGCRHHQEFADHEQNRCSLPIASLSSSNDEQAVMSSVGTTMPSLHHNEADSCCQTAWTKDKPNRLESSKATCRKAQADLASSVSCQHLVAWGARSMHAQCLPFIESCCHTKYSFFVTLSIWTNSTVINRSCAGHSCAQWCVADLEPDCALQCGDGLAQVSCGDPAQSLQRFL